MTNDAITNKICPFMSRSIYIDHNYVRGVQLMKVFCRGEECAAYKKYASIDDTDTADDGICMLMSRGGL